MSGIFIVGHKMKMRLLKILNISQFAVSQNILLNPLVACANIPSIFLYRQESFVQKMKKIINENPWIVALLVVVIGLPISIILYMLCSSSPKKVGMLLQFIFSIVNI